MYFNIAVFGHAWYHETIAICWHISNSNLDTATKYKTSTNLHQDLLLYTEVSENYKNFYVYKVGIPMVWPQCSRLVTLRLQQLRGLKPVDMSATSALYTML